MHVLNIALNFELRVAFTVALVTFYKFVILFIIHNIIYMHLLTFFGFSNRLWQLFQDHLVYLLDA